MKTFDPLRPTRRLMDADGFLAHSSDHAYSPLYRHTISELKKIDEEIQARFPIVDEYPSMLISSESTVQAHASELLNSVQLTQGLIDFFISRSPSLRRSAQGLSSAAETTTGGVNVLPILWSYSHEVFHIIRRHSLIETFFHSSPHVLMAIEYDADMCATAAVYRYVQKHHCFDNPSDAKLAAMLGINTSLMSLADIEGPGASEVNRSHYTVPGRMVQIVSKLAIMNDLGFADPDGVEPSSKRDAHHLLNALHEATLDHMAMNSESRVDHGILDYAKGIIEGPDMLSPIQMWADIAGFAERASRTSRNLLPSDAAAEDIEGYMIASALLRLLED